MRWWETYYPPPAERLKNKGRFYMYEVDFARGFAYKGKKGFIVRTNPKGLYVEKGLKKIFLTNKNSRVAEESYELV